MEYVRLKFKGISDILGMESQLSLLVMVDEEEMRQLVVTCDLNMRNQLKMRMEGKTAGQHLLPEVLAEAWGMEQCRCWEVRINGMQEGKYLTKLFHVATGAAFDIRCSDAILWAFVSHCTVKVRTDVLAAYGVPYFQDANQIALPVNVITDSMLEVGLQKAIDSEDYEGASKLRDELKRRHAKRE